MPPPIAAPHGPAREPAIASAAVFPSPNLSATPDAATPRRAACPPTRAADLPHALIPAAAAACFSPIPAVADCAARASRTYVWTLAVRVRNPNAVLIAS